MTTLQELVDRAVARGDRELVLDPGFYVVDEPIQLPGDFRLVGARRQACGRRSTQA